MEKALLVNAGAGDSLDAILREAGGCEPVRAQGLSQARALMDAGECALILIVAGPGDESARSLAVEAARRTTAGVICLCREGGDGPEADAALLREGVQVVAHPPRRAALDQAVRDALAARGRLLALRSENRQLQYKLDEAHIVGRAKGTLMQHLGMTEPQAHRYIEKQAMDLRTTRMEIAKNILKNYGL